MAAPKVLNATELLAAPELLDATELLTAPEVLDATELLVAPEVLDTLLKHFIVYMTLSSSLSSTARPD